MLTNMRKSKTNSATCLTSEQKEKRSERISKSKQAYEDTIQDTIKRFSNMGIELTFVQEFNFKDNWRFDYYCPELGLAIEFEGGRGHVHMNRYMGDLDKYNRAVIYGYPHLLRFVIDTLDEVFPQVYQFYRQRSKRCGGVIDNVKVDRIDAKLSSNFEPSKGE